LQKTCKTIITAQHEYSPHNLYSAPVVNIRFAGGGAAEVVNGAQPPLPSPSTAT